MKFWLKTALAAAALTLGATGAFAATLSVNSFDNGWYNSSGFHSRNNTNIYTTATYNHFLAFDLSSFVGEDIVGATVRYRRNGSYRNSGAAMALSLWDVDTDTNVLLTGRGGVAAHADLEGGDSYGSASVATPGPAGSMQSVSVTLSAAAIGDLKARLTASDKRFVIGGSVDAVNDSAYLWGFSRGSGAATLTVETAPPIVPLPASGLLLIGALGAVGALRAKRRARD